MTTLAQMMLTDSAHIRTADEISHMKWVEATERVKRLLSMPTPGDVLTDTPMRAERFVFDENPIDLFDDLKANKQVAYEQAQEFARMPAPIVWIEWRQFDPGAGDHYKIGYLLDTTYKHPINRQGAVLVMCCIQGKKQSGYRPICYSSFWLDALDGSMPDAKQRQIGLVWHYHYESEKEGQDEIAVSVTDIYKCLFLLSVPRACEIRNVEWEPKKQAQRIKQGKAPLLNLRQVKFKIGAGPVKYRSASGGGNHVPADEVDHGTGGSKKAAHQVLGHFRTYVAGERFKQNSVKWIEPHWRGDPALGIITHERRVQK